MKHNDHMKRFLNDHVNLNQSRIDTLDRQVKSTTDYLKSNLENYRNVSKQGSYEHGTIIKPVKGNDDFDADILVLIEDNQFDPYRFDKDYVKFIYDVFKDIGYYTDRVKLKTRYCTIDYVKDRHHIDVVPCIKYKDLIFICNRDEKKYEITDGNGYKEWINERNRIVGGGNFKKATRLFKFLRDHKDNFTIKSILLTTILGERISQNDFKFLGNSEFEDLVETLFTLSNRVNDWLQKNPSMPIIENPVLKEEEFSRNWTGNEYRNFREKFSIYTRMINEAYSEQCPEKSVTKWRKIFGNEFGELPNSKTPKGVASAGAAGTIVSPRAFAHKPYSPLMPRKIMALGNYEFSTTEMEKIQKYFPNLIHENGKIKGVIEFQAMFKHTKRRKKNPWEVIPCSSGAKCIKDSYTIEIHLSDLSLGYPKVFEVGGRITNLARELDKPIQDLHLYPQDGSCCLGIFSSNQSETLSAFVINKVYPYFMWQAYYEKFEEIPPVGEHPHG